MNNLKRRERQWAWLRDSGRVRRPRSVGDSPHLVIFLFNAAVAVPVSANAWRHLLPNRVTPDRVVRCVHDTVTVVVSGNAHKRP